jgi:leucyl/phenylalanyl-tRNA--protein transferase
VEIWDEQRLIGGLYGVSLGQMFYGESMFSRESDASKVALCAWVAKLRELGFRVIDCQQNTAHLASMGAREIDREIFLQHLHELCDRSAPDWAAVRLEFAPA